MSSDTESTRCIHSDKRILRANHLVTFQWNRIISVHKQNAFKWNANIECANVKSFVKLFVLPKPVQIVQGLICLLDFLLVYLLILCVFQSIPFFISWLCYEFHTTAIGFGCVELSLLVMGMCNFICSKLCKNEVNYDGARFNWCEL